MNVTKAEEEASEVLHTLLSVARVQSEQPTQQTDEPLKIQWNLNEEHLYTLHPVKIEAWSETVNSGETSEQHQEDQVLTTDVEDQHERKEIKKKLIKKKVQKNTDDKNRIDDNAQAVRARFQLGCDCNDESCFRGLNPESVYRHRLNIADLTKEEHDMYLMGVTMACLGNVDSTVKRKARQRLRSTYVHHGQKVCLSAFLYLENCTLYQLKRIRKHLMIHGVAPRVHGNHGKKPHNVFSLDIYRRATDFLRNFIKVYSTPSGNMKAPVTLPAEITRKTIHKRYEEYIRSVAPPEEKLMGYSTFRHFMKEQFPQVRFCKTDLNGQNLAGQSSRYTTTSHNKMNKNTTDGMGNGEEIGIPVILSDWKEEGQTYIVAPVQEVVSQEFIYEGEEQQIEGDNIFWPICDESDLMMENGTEKMEQI